MTVTVPPSSERSPSTQYTVSVNGRDSVSRSSTSKNISDIECHSGPQQSSHTAMKHLEMGSLKEESSDATTPSLCDYAQARNSGSDNSGARLDLKLSIDESGNDRLYQMKNEISNDEIKRLSDLLNNEHDQDRIRQSLLAEFFPANSKEYNLTFQDLLHLIPSQSDVRFRLTRVFERTNCTSCLQCLNAICT